MKAPHLRRSNGIIGCFAARVKTIPDPVSLRFRSKQVSIGFVVAAKKEEAEASPRFTISNFLRAKPFNHLMQHIKRAGLRKNV